MSRGIRNAHVLIVEDDTFTQRTLQEIVELEGATVRLAASVEEARQAIGEAPPDIVILDINLPDELGFSLAKEIRDNLNAGIIILTVRDSERDRLLGLDLGADEFLTKPVRPRELGLRIRNMLGRIETWSQPAAGRTEALTFGDWRFSPAERLLANETGEKQILTRMEADILLLLAGRPGYVFSREELIGPFHIGGEIKPVRAVDNIVMRLRKKLGQSAKDNSHIETVTGQGYRFNILPHRVDGPS